MGRVLLPEEFEELAVLKIDFLEVRSRQRFLLVHPLPDPRVVDSE